MSTLRCLRAGLAWILGIPGLAWAGAALYFDGPAAPWLAGLGATALMVAGLAVLLFVRVPWRGLALLGLIGGVAFWWTQLSARNDRDWQPDVARLPWATVDDDRLTIHNVRNFDYRSEHDFTEVWETHTYDLAALRGVDLFLCFWGPSAIAHTIASWQFADGQHLAISIETRKQRGESYSALRGFFRQYELYYVVADERDVVRLRTNYRGETVYLYRVRMAPAQARAILLSYLEEVNRLRERPRWYNALTHNCTTMIRHHVQQVSPGNPWSWQLLLNGHLDELAYARGTIDTSLPFLELKARSNISGVAHAADAALDFSARIREGLPGTHAPR